MKLDKGRSLSLIQNRLASIINDLGRLQLESGDVGCDGIDSPSSAASGWNRADRLKEIDRQQFVRDMRYRHFDRDLVSEFAWNMLLYCYAENLRGGQPTISEMCYASLAPATTASRHLQALIDGGLLVRSADVSDGRRAFIALSDQGERAMNRFFEAIEVADRRDALPTNPMGLGQPEWPQMKMAK